MIIKQALHIFLTWQEKEKSESNQTPNSAGERILPSILTWKISLSVLHTQSWSKTE